MVEFGPAVRLGSVIFAASQDPQTWWEVARVWLIGTPLRIAIILVVAIVLQIVLIKTIRRIVKRTARKARNERLAQNRKMARTAELSTMLLNERTEQRSEAIGSLLTSVVSIVIWTIAILMILPLLGVNVAPILASAGVLGVALGFGAQTMVRDYLAGIFLIIEDQFGVGDVVDVGPVIGTVEQVTLRYTRLRDATGVVWYVQNGEILRVANRSQGWTMAIVDIPVGYNEDLDKVRGIVERVAEDMDSDPSYDDMLLSTPMFAGVESVTGEAVFIRISAKSAPEQQIPLARELRERMKLAFDRAGITVPVVTRGMYPAGGTNATFPETGGSPKP